MKHFSGVSINKYIIGIIIISCVCIGAILSQNEKYPEGKIYVETTIDDAIRITQKQDAYFLIYEYGWFIDDSINSKCYRLTSIWVENDSHVKIWDINFEESDIEGVVKLYGEDDYLGSIHGDEVYKSIFVTIDDSITDIDKVEAGYCDSVSFTTESLLYHQDSEKEAFLKEKTTVINDAGVTVTSKFKAMDDVIVNHVRLPANLLKVENEKSIATNYSSVTANVNAKTLTDYRENSYHECCVMDNMKDVTLEGGLCNMSVQLNYYNSNDVVARIVDFGFRYKVYFDCYNNKELSEGDTIQTSYSYSYHINGGLK
ncbi:MAG: hypothetical protein MJ133_01420 [Lachnospiraceae bacterium]|nr:hypothetical protein [Lachnospiraceae bacterium]